MQQFFREIFPTAIERRSAYFAQLKDQEDANQAVLEAEGLCQSYDTTLDIDQEIAIWNKYKGRTYRGTFIPFIEVFILLNPQTKISRISYDDINKLIKEIHETKSYHSSIQRMYQKLTQHRQEKQLAHQRSVHIYELQESYTNFKVTQSMEAQFGIGFHSKMASIPNYRDYYSNSNNSAKRMFEVISRLYEQIFDSPLYDDDLSNIQAIDDLIIETLKFYNKDNTYFTDLNDIVYLVIKFIAEQGQNTNYAHLIIKFQTILDQIEQAKKQAIIQQQMEAAKLELRNQAIRRLRFMHNSPGPFDEAVVKSTMDMIEKKEI